MIASNVDLNLVFHRCEHPVRISDRRGYRYVRCGHCPACLALRASKLKKRCEQEFHNADYPHSLFITLTYNDESLPLFVRRFDPETGWISPYFINHSSGKLIHHSELDLSSPNNLPYAPRNYRSILQQRDIEVSQVYQCFSGFEKTDIQLFFKRLRKHISTHFSIREKAFRYFVVSEYGSLRHRPHYHMLLFVRTKELQDFLLRPASDPNSSHAQVSLSSLWSKGITDSQVPELAKGVGSYVAGYINSLSLNNVNYSHSFLRPFYLASSSPSFGLDKAELSDCQKAIEECTASGTFDLSSVRSLWSDSSSSVTRTLYSKSVEYQLLPKCKGFNRLSFRERVEKYSVLLNELCSRNLIERVYVFSSNSSVHHRYRVHCDDYKLSTKSVLRDLRKKILFASRSSYVVYYESAFYTSSVEPLSELDIHAARVCLAWCLRTGHTAYEYVKMVSSYYTSKESELLRVQCAQYSAAYEHTKSNNYLLSSDLELRRILGSMREDYNAVRKGSDLFLKLLSYNDIDTSVLFRDRFDSVEEPEFVSARTLYLESARAQALRYDKSKKINEKTKRVCW